MGTDLALEGFDLPPFFDDGELGLGEVDGHCEIGHRQQMTSRECARDRSRTLLQEDILHSSAVESQSEIVCHE